MNRVLAAAMVVAMPVEMVMAQASMNVPVGGTGGAPVAQTPPADAEDTPEEIAKDAARDLKDNRFYNKPGATRAQYDADWQTCRLIARGSRTPSGTVPYFYNPAVISPLAAGIGAGIGGLIGSAIAEGQQRRANRRSCLLIKGWRMVETPDADAARIAAMTDEQRDAHFNAIVGATEVQGEVTERTSFELAADPNLRLDAPIAAPASVFLGKKVDPAAPFALAEGEGAIVFAYRRPDIESTGRSATVDFARYDAANRDLVYQPRDWKKKGDKTTYAISAGSKDKKSPLEVQVRRVTPGDYVVRGTAVGPGVLVTNSYCFGAPTIRVAAGEVVYVGDFVPYMGAKLAAGGNFHGLAYTSNIEDTRKTLAISQPALAAALKPATLHDRATYACSGIVMDRWDWPGVADMPEVTATTSDGAASSIAVATP